MHECSNCQKKVDLSMVNDAGFLVLRDAGAVIAALCPDCTAGVRTTKIVLQRPSRKAPFDFDSLLNVECWK